MAGVSPNFSPQRDGCDTKGHRFASSGKVLMLVLVISFTSFFLFLVILVYSKRPNLHLSQPNSTPEVEIHPTIQFPRPLVSGCKGSCQNPPQEPQISEERTQQSVAPS
ncbi:hypothetical protein SAY86_029745 [Trapa natans]|uniref:Transmembrane protein n=1 Tax=Trapa natans TaxID=22666 RepID=A0AAN7R9Y8_TRANT|nr:hypothetical protein SAY86_029745 [Trapa natans]